MKIKKKNKPLKMSESKYVLINPVKPFKKKSYVGKFIFIVASIVGVFLAVATVAAYGYVKSSAQAAQALKERQLAKATASGQALASPIPSDNTDKNDGFLVPPRKTNFVLMGLDKNENLSDVVIAGCFDRETKKIDLISLPRDTYVQLEESDIRFLQKHGRHPTPSGIMKINAVHSYAGKEYGATFLKQEVEDILGIKIDYYAEINLEAFRYIVDAVGGVDMQIPDRGLYYNDPTQNLEIRVPGGMQHLDGEDAEGVVRYRSTYKRGDLQRIEMQQEFLKQFFKQVINKDTIINNAGSFLSTAIKYVNTNFGVTDAPKYIRYLDELDSENFSAFTLPGYPETINGASFYIHDKDKTKALAYNIFYSNNSTKNTVPPSSTKNNANTSVNTQTQQPGTSAAPTKTESPASTYSLEDAKKMKISILNGSTTKGLAAKKRNLLTKNGYNVVSIDTYTGNQVGRTRIIVKEKGKGNFFEKFFINTVVEIDSGLPDNIDIVVVLGLDEK